MTWREVVRCRRPGGTTRRSGTRVKERFGQDSVGAFYGVAAQGQTVVAVGAAGPNVPASPEQDALVWTFSDGEWLRVCREACGNSVSGGGSRGQKMWDVVHRSGGGFVAVGYDVIERQGDALRCGSLDLIGRTRMEPRARRPGGVRRSSRPGHARCDRNALGPPGRSRGGTQRRVRSGRRGRAGVDARRRRRVWSAPRVRLRQTHRHHRGGQPAGGRWVRRARTRRGNRRGRVGLGRRSGRVAGASSPPRSRNGEERALGGAATGHGTVAVGYEHPENENQAAVAWLLSGRTVRRIENEIFRGPGDREINAAAVLAGGRLLAVGDGPSPDNDANSEQDARVGSRRPSADRVVRRWSAPRGRGRPRLKHAFATLSPAAAGVLTGYLASAYGQAERR